MRAVKRDNRIKSDVGFNVWITLFEYTVVGVVIMWLWLMLSSR